MATGDGMYIPKKALKGKKNKNKTDAKTLKQGQETGLEYKNERIQSPKFPVS